MSEESILAALSVDNARAHVEHIIYQIRSRLAISDEIRALTVCPGWSADRFLGLQRRCNPMLQELCAAPTAQRLASQLTTKRAYHS